MEDRRIHEVINYFVFVSLFLKTNRFHVSVRQFNNKQLLDEVEHDIKQLLDEVFVISGIIKVAVNVISRSRRLRLITLTEILRA